MPHRFAHDRKAAYLALALDDLFVGQHRAQLFTPPNGRLAYVRQSQRVNAMPVKLSFFCWFEPFELFMDTAQK